MKIKFFYLLSIIAGYATLLGSSAFAYQAEKDNSFDIGKLNGYFNSSVLAETIQNDGKIIVGGNFTSYSGTIANRIIRLNTNGTRDNSFNIGDGFDNTTNAFAIQSDGKIIVGGGFTTYQGTSANRIVRLNADGSRDNTFNVGAGFDSAILSIAIQSDGKIVVGGGFTTYQGTSANRIVRLNSDGSRDNSFSIGSGFNDWVYSIAKQSDEKIIVAGNFTTYQGTTANRIIRLNTDGSRDNTFNIGAAFSVLSSYTQSIAIQSDGKIVIGGNFSIYSGTSANKIIRLNTDGTRDNSFNIGVGFDNHVSSLTIQSDGKIVVVGGFTTYQGTTANRIIRLNSNGSKDNTFNIGNGFDQQVSVLIIQADNKVIAAGLGSYNGEAFKGIIRLNTDGSRDNTLNIGNSFSDTIYALASQSDGKVLVGGSFTTYKGTSANRIVRLNSDGSRDNSFNIGTAFNNSVTKIAIQNDGKIIVIGSFVSYNGSTANQIIRLNADGTKDNSFNIGNGFGGREVQALAIQSDGKIIVGGNFSTYSGATANRIVRLNTDGTKDNSFDMGNGFNSMVYAIAIQSDGKIVVGGTFTTYSGVTANRIAVLNSNGLKDSSFKAGSAFNNTVNTIAIQNDGKIVVGGIFQMYSGGVASRIIRLNIDGTKDTGFYNYPGFDYPVNDLAIQSDGKIIVGGNFSTYSGVNFNGIVRLNIDGTISNTFVDVGSGFNGFDTAGPLVKTLSIQNDGKIIAGGRFLTYNKESTPYLIALKGDTSVKMPSVGDTSVIQNQFTYRGYTLSGNELSGSTRISLEESNGRILKDIIIKNQNNKLILPENLQFKKGDNITNYSGEIIPPTPISVSTVENKPVISAIKVGSTTESIKMTGGEATLNMVASGSSIGDSVKIYSSQDGTNWTLEKNGKVISLDGKPSVSFTTNHFTYFAILGETGSFIINNGDTSTADNNVTLNITASGAQHMRFSNDNSNWSSWETYSTTKSRTLSNGNGSKTVYAEFDTDNNNIGDISTSDSIEYNKPLTSNVQGNIKLQILSGVSECVYGTSLFLGNQDIKLNQAYSFSGTFGNEWSCSDYIGVASGWSLTIQTSDLNNGKGNVISGSNVSISHGGSVTQGDPACIGSAGTQTAIFAAPYTIMEKAPNNDKICKVSVSNVALKVNVPANQAPGNYVGTLTLTVPNF